MREYELTLIVHPELEETAFKEALEKVTGWITEGGGEIIKQDLWGKRELAYPIQKLDEGNYVFFSANMAPTFCVELERNLRFLEPVIRYLLIAKD